MNKFKKLLVLLLIAFAYASVFTLPYIRYILYDPMLEALNCTNLELGTMMTFFGLVCTISYIPGGWVADRFSAKKIMTISLIAHGILSFCFGLFMNIKVGYVIWALMPLSSTFAMWAACLKGVRMLGSKDDQGKTFGVFESCIGLCYVILYGVALALFARYVDQVAGFKMVVYVYAAANILAGILIWLLFDGSMEETITERPKINFKEVLAVVKKPHAWLLGIVVFSIYGVYVGLSYLTPYLTAVVGVTVTFSGILAIIRTDGVKMLSGPAAGVIADKVKSTAKIVIVGQILVICLLLVFLNVPDNPSIAMIMALMLLIAFVVGGIKGIMWSAAEELKIPASYTGIAVGIASIIGFAPDMIVSPLFGYFLDTYGNAGYNYMFTFMIGVAIVGILAAGWTLVLKRKPAFEEITENVSKSIAG